MFESFFPRLKLFFLSAIAWSAVVIFIWYSFGDTLGRALGFALDSDPQNPIIGVSYFISSEFLWFYVYYVLICALFAAFWFRHLPH